LKIKIKPLPNWVVFQTLYWILCVKEMSIRKERAGEK